MTSSDLTLPIRIGENGERRPPSGTDPYTLPWVPGAAATVHRATLAKYPEGVRDLREKLAVLRSKRARKEHTWPVDWSPMPYYLRRLYEGHPPADDGTPFGVKEM